MSANIIKKYKNKQILDRLKKRDKDAFVAAYDEHITDIYRFIYFKIGSEEEARDITSSVFLKTWHHIQNNSLESAKTLRALFYKIARNVIIDYYRQQEKIKVLSIEDENNKIEITSEVNEEERLDIKQNIRLIKEKLPQLKEEYRDIIIMRFINELELEEISDITGKNKGNIRVLSHRALKALKDLLSKEGESEKKV